jgi:hypothetical protein
MGLESDSGTHRLAAEGGWVVLGVAILTAGLLLFSVLHSRRQRQAGSDRLGLVPGYSQFVQRMMRVTQSEALKLSQD